jgi:hypothetical protein
MRVLTVRQPWAALIAHGYKDVENRSWAPVGLALGERFAIHAGRLDDKHKIESLAPLSTLADGLEIVQGAVIATVRFDGTTTDSTSQWALPGCVHWLLSEPELVEPVHMRGFPMLWTLHKVTLTPTIRRR